VADLYNPGKDIIDAYLKGVAIRQEKERFTTQRELEQQRLELARKTAEQNWKRFESNLEETKRLHDSTIDANRSTINSHLLDTKLKIAKGIQDGDIVIDESGQPQFTKPGTRTQVKANEAGAIETAKTPTLIERAGGVEAAKQPYSLERIDAQNKGRATIQLADQLWKSVENEKNRINARDVAAIRAQATLANKNSTKEEKAQTINDAIDAYKDDIFTGRLPVDNQAFPKGDAGLKIQTAMRANNVRMINQKEADKLTGLRTLDGFINKLGELNSLLQEGGIVGQATNPKIKQLQQELEADLVLFGREAKGEKGVVTDKDIDRLKGAIPQILPGGFTSIRDSEGRKAANSRRVKQAIDVYHEKFDSILGEKISPVQKEAIRKEYGIRERPKAKLPDYLEPVP